MQTTKVKKPNPLRSMAGFIRVTTGVVAHACSHPRYLWRPAIRRVFYKQVYFTGVQAVLPVVIAGLGISAGLFSQLFSVLGGRVEIGATLFYYIIILEVAPIITSFVVLSRSGAAMATELAAMKVRGEVRLLYLLGISPGDYLLLPRVLACCVVIPALTLLFQLVATVAGPAAISVFVEMRLMPFYRDLIDELSLTTLLIMFVKSACFGLIISSVTCTTGIHVPRQRIWIPQAAEISALRCLVSILLADALFAILIVLLR